MTRKVQRMRRVAAGSVEQIRPDADRHLIVSLRLTVPEMALLSIVAEQTGTSVSHVIRGRVFGPWDELSRRVEAIESRLREIETAS